MPIVLWENLVSDKTLNQKDKEAWRDFLLQEVVDYLQTNKDEIIGRITTQVTVGDYFGQRDDALRAHATQIDPNGSFFAVPLDVQRKLWPTEEFELARTRVTTSLPETDLFAGIEETEQ